MSAFNTVVQNLSLQCAFTVSLRNNLLLDTSRTYIPCEILFFPYVKFETPNMEDSFTRVHSFNFSNLKQET